MVMVENLERNLTDLKCEAEENLTNSQLVSAIVLSCSFVKIHTFISFPEDGLCVGENNMFSFIFA